MERNFRSFAESLGMVLVISAFSMIGTDFDNSHESEIINGSLERETDLSRVESIGVRYYES